MKLRRVPMLAFLVLVVLLSILLGGPTDLAGDGGGAGDGGDGGDAGDGAGAAGSANPAPGPFSDRAPKFIVRKADRENDLLDVDPGHDSRVDLVLSRCLAIESALEAGDVAGAFQLLDQSAGQDVPETVQSRWQQTQQRAAEALTRAMRQLAGEVGRGEILAARKSLCRLLQPASKSLRQRLAAVLGRRGWPLWPKTERGGTVSLASAKSLPTLARDRLVRVPHRSEIVAGRVWQHEGGKVTVRLQNRQGVTFPVFDREALEPVQPTFAEATDQLRACYRAGELWSAWLWLCHVGSRPEARDHGPELAQMRELVSPAR